MDHTFFASRVGQGLRPLWVWGQSSLHNEFQASQNYILRSYLKKIPSVKHISLSLQELQCEKCQVPEPLGGYRLAFGWLHVGFEYLPIASVYLVLNSWTQQSCRQGWKPSLSVSTKWWYYSGMPCAKEAGMVVREMSISNSPNFTCPQCLFFTIIFLLCQWNCTRAPSSEINPVCSGHSFQALFPHVTCQEPCDVSRNEDALGETPMWAINQS